MKYSEAQTKIIIEIASMTFLNEDLQFLEGLEEFFRGNARIISDCLVFSILKHFLAASMLAEIVQSSFTGLGDPSDLCSHICCVTIFNLCQES